MAAKDNHIHFHLNNASHNVMSNFEHVPNKKSIIKYVGVNSNAYSPLGTIRYSKDGRNWSNIKSGGFDSNSGGIAVARGQNKWIAIGNDNLLSGLNSIQYSRDGINWSNTNSATIRFPLTIKYGLNKWVVGCVSTRGISSILHSGDGSNWTNTNAKSIATNGLSLGLDIYNSTIFVAASTANNGALTTSTIQWSTNGLNWSNSISGGFLNNYYSNTPTANDVAYGSNMWVAVGHSDSPLSSIQWSKDAKNWSNAHIGGFNYNYGGNYFGSKIVYGNNMWLALGHANTLRASIQYSKNGSNWSNAGFGLINIPQNITYSSNMWIAYGDPIQYSSNGSNWTYKNNDVSFVAHK